MQMYLSFSSQDRSKISVYKCQTRMFSARITISVLLVSLTVFQHTDAWRRRRRRQCSPVACKVSFWSPWSSCNADKCGQQGSRHRTRTELSPSSCGGAAFPGLTETIPCSSTEKVDRQVSPWSEWSACTTPCGVSGIQSSSRHRIITEQCGGTCVSTFRKTRACPELKCLNGGSLKKGTCFCKESFAGSCCEKDASSDVGLIIEVIFAVVSVLIVASVFIYRKYFKKNNQVGDSTDNKNYKSSK